MKKLIFLFVMAFACVTFTAADDGGCLLEGNPLEASISETIADIGTVCPETVSITLSHYGAAEVIGVESHRTELEKVGWNKVHYPHEYKVDIGKPGALNQCYLFGCYT